MTKRKQASAPHVDDGPAAVQGGGKEDEGRAMYSLPPRFQASVEEDRRTVMVTDLESHRTIPVAASSFGEIRRLLGAFFGGEYEGHDTFMPGEEGPPAATAAPDPVSVPPPVDAPRRAPKAAAEPRQVLPGASAPAAGTAAPDRAPSVRKPEQAPAKTPPKEAPGRSAFQPEDTAFHSSPAPSASKAGKAPRASKPVMPEGWEHPVASEHYALEFEIDAQTGEPGYRVTVGKDVVAEVRKGSKGKFIVRWREDRAQPSPHSNLRGVQSRLDVVLDPD